MAARKRHDKIDSIAAAKQRQVDDRVRRARLASPPRGAEYYVACGELAQRVGADPGDVMDDLDHAAAVIEYEGNVSRQEAERLAMEQVRDRYERQRRIA